MTGVVQGHSEYNDPNVDREDSERYPWLAKESS